jgi:thioredoxin-dependent peroxiredoxin
MVEVGDIAPEFCLLGDDELEVCLKTYRGRWIVLYFYPKDNTSGCTREAVDFTAALDGIHAMGAEVLGISRDSTASHKKFAEKHEIKVKLLSNPDHKVMDAYGVWSLKKMYGKEAYGVVRSTFLIDPNGRIAHIWRSIKVKGHVQAVVEALKSSR